MEYKYADIAKKIIKAAMNVHGAFASRFQEVIYQRSLKIEFELMGTQLGHEVCIPVFYKNVQAGERRGDFPVEEKNSVELKAFIGLGNVHLAQVKNYLEAFNGKVALLFNTGSGSLQFKRLYNNKHNTVNQK